MTTTSTRIKKSITTFTEGEIKLISINYSEGAMIFRVHFTDLSDRPLMKSQRYQIDPIDGDETVNRINLQILQGLFGPIAGLIKNPEGFIGTKILFAEDSVVTLSNGNKVSNYELHPLKSTVTDTQLAQFLANVANI